MSSETEFVTPASAAARTAKGGWESAGGGDDGNGSGGESLVERFWDIFNQQADERGFTLSKEAVDRLSETFYEAAHEIESGPSGFAESRSEAESNLIGFAADIFDESMRRGTSEVPDDAVATVLLICIFWPFCVGRTKRKDEPAGASS
jgi:hypothetical protein